MRMGHRQWLKNTLYDATSGIQLIIDPCINKYSN